MTFARRIERAALTAVPARARLGVRTSYMGLRGRLEPEAFVLPLVAKLHDPDGAFFDMEHAKRLAGSPRLTAQQKRDIFKQLGYPVDPFCEK